MSTAAVTPEVVVGAPASTTPVTLTPNAVAKVKEIMASQNPVPAGLRIGVVGGGCSGFQYSMSFENAAGMMDKVYKFDDLKVFVDATSAMYLVNCTVDYVETLEAAGLSLKMPRLSRPAGADRALAFRRFCFFYLKRSLASARDFFVILGFFEGGFGKISVFEMVFCGEVVVISW